MKFEWDTNKEQKNIRKHGINFEQASYVFSDPFALNLYDKGHSQHEHRWILLGHSLSETIIVVIHTFNDCDGDEIVRIISASKANKTETKTYKQRCIK